MFVQVDMSLMLPHQWFSRMFWEYRPAFMELLFGAYAGRAGLYWDAMAGWDGYPEVLKDGRPDLHRCVPITLHGDGRPITGANSAWSGSADGKQRSPTMTML